MRDEDSLRDEEKRNVTNDSGTGKGLLHWLTPSDGSAHVDSEETTSSLDRRSYMQLAGSAAAAAAMGGAASATAAAGTTGSGDTLDVTADPYNAAGDGSTDDSGAIQAAIDDASSGDTVYFPAGTYAVEGSGRIFDLSAADPPVLTLEGEGEDSVILFNGGNSGSSSESVMLFRLEDHDDFTIRNLVIDGNRGALNGSPNVHHLISTRGTRASYTFEDVVVQNARDGGISMWYTGDVEINRATVRNNGNHGISFREPEAVDPGLRVRNSLIEENSVVQSGYYGIDAANGKCLIEDTVIRNNSGGATKTSHTGMVDTTYRRVRFDSNGGLVYLSTDGDQGAVTFENIVAENNGQGIRCSYLDYYFEGENVITNTGDTGMFQASGGQVVSADEIHASNNDGHGVWGSPIRVDTLYADDNTSGAYSGGADVGEVVEDTKTDLDVVPSADEVGAWTGDDDHDDDDGNGGDDDGGEDNGNGGEDDDDVADDPTVDDYAHPETGVVEAGGVFDALADWRADDIETDMLWDVIAAWRSGEPVE